MGMVNKDPIRPQCREQFQSLIMQAATIRRG